MDPGPFHLPLRPLLLQRVEELAQLEGLFREIAGAPAERSACLRRAAAGGGKSRWQTAETEAGAHARGRAVRAAHRRNNDISFQSARAAEA